MSPTANRRRCPLVLVAALLLPLAGAACGVQAGNASLAAGQPTPKPGAPTPPTPTRSPAAKPKTLQPPAPPSDCPSQPVGIQTDHQPPGPDFYTVDHWTGYVGKTSFAVFAGAPYANSLTSPDQPSSTGTLLELDGGTNADCFSGAGAHFRWVTDSSIPGPFDIVAADGARLTVKGANGATFYYTVAAASQEPGVTTSQHCC
ncbi:MAG: hypothetical protein ACYDB7_00095 [Mycobacteriales bacterium]